MQQDLNDWPTEREEKQQKNNTKRQIYPLWP